MLQELAYVATDPFFGENTAARHRTEPTSPPHRRATASVRPRRFCLARHLPLFPCKLSRSDSHHLVTWLDAAGRASPTPRAWPPRSDHGQRAPSRAGAGQAGLAARLRQSGREAVMAGCRSWLPHPIGLRPRARFSQVLCDFLLKSFLIVVNSRKPFKFPKFIETCRNVQKLQNKFCINTLEAIYTVGLTKLSLMQFLLVQNCKNSITKLIVYKYLHFIIF
jgi:hypothetical protein